MKCISIALFVAQLLPLMAEGAGKSWTRRAELQIIRASLSAPRSNPTLLAVSVVVVLLDASRPTTAVTLLASVVFVSGT